MGHDGSDPASALVGIEDNVVSAQGHDGEQRWLAVETTADVDEDSGCERWLARWSLALVDLNRSRLSSIDLSLGMALDGSQWAPSTAGRFRKVSWSCIRRVVDVEIIPTDPWPPASRGRVARQNS